ncbi:hypothetical protein FRC09_006368 [Ceratobasidium sp. 395]|nr:hypothetical protein FRC09_006368 [Ceratobasidium sp. 395]
MPPRGNKLHQRPLKSTLAAKPIKHHTIQASGSQNAVKVTETTASKLQQPVASVDANDLLTLTCAIQEDLDEQDIGPVAAPRDFDNAPIAADGALSALASELEFMLDDAQETMTGAAYLGKAQNKMLLQWFMVWSILYLNQLFMAQAPPSRRCALQSTSCHEYMPTHRIQKWARNACSTCSLQSEGLILALGPHTGLCPHPETQSMTVGDVTGMHTVSMAFGGCAWAPKQNMQLLQANIFPCSDSDPSTGFTFAALQLYHFASAESKLLASCFYSLLQRSTNNIMPHLHLNRFQEFMRTSRMWTYLQDLKRSGAYDLAPTTSGSLALRCPACPCLGVNYKLSDVVSGQECLYSQQITYNGTFQLTRKNKAHNEYDICLSDGTKYWVQQEEYKTHLEANKDTAYEQSTRNFWKQLGKVLLSGPSLNVSMVFGGIGKYHIAGHTKSCNAQYLPNFIVGVGHLDAKGSERGWADINQASWSSSEKGSGFQIDSINNAMHDWNWRKLIAIIAHILQKYAEAAQMAEEQEAQWWAFDKMINDTELTTFWASLSTEPQRVGNTNNYTSVFISREGTATLISRTILDINKEEQTARGSSNQQQGFTAPAWVAEGLEIEVQQQQLEEDIKEYGTGITDRQSLDVFNRQSSLSSRIIRHCSNTALYLDVAPSSSGAVESLAEKTDSQPEIASLFLPSQAKKLVIRSERTLCVSSIKYWLRRVACFCTIHCIKVTLIQKMNMIKTKEKHATGQICNTRSQVAVNQISERAEAAVWEFNNSYKAMKTLSFKDNDASLLKSIKLKDLSGIVTILGGAKKLGKGYKKLPWFWLLKSDSKQ